MSNNYRYLILDIKPLSFTRHIEVARESFEDLKGLGIDEGVSITFKFENEDVRTIKTIKFTEDANFVVTTGAKPDDDFLYRFWVHKGMVLLTEPLPEDAEIVSWKINSV